MKSNRKTSPSPNQKTTKQGKQMLNYEKQYKLGIERENPNQNKNKNVGNQSSTKKTNQKEPQKNYITIIKTNKQTNSQPETHTTPNMQQEQSIQTKQELGIKQVHSQKVLNSSSIQSIESPILTPTAQYNKGQSQFANSPRRLINIEQLTQNQNQPSPKSQHQYSGYEYAYPQEYQYMDMINNYVPYYQNMEDNSTPQQNISYQIDNQISGINNIKQKEISMMSGNDSQYNLNDYRYNNRNDISRFNQQQYSYYNTPQPQPNIQINNSYQINQQTSQKSQLQSYIIKSNQIQLQIANNMNKHNPFNHYSDNNNSTPMNISQSQIKQEQNTNLTMKQVSQINQKNRVPYGKGEDEIQQVSQFQIQKKWEVFDLPFKNTIASAIQEKGETYIYRFDPQGANPDLTRYKINYKFPVNPSNNLVIDQKNGRLFLYDNNGHVLVFSQDLDFNEGKPLIKLSLEETFPRRNPVLFVKTYDTYTLLFVIGGFVKQQTVKQIKVFKIERRYASIRFELTLNTLKKRRSPAVFTYSTKVPINNQNKQQNLNQSSKEQQEVEKEYLILLGGSSHDPDSDANITGEYIEMDKIHNLINQRNNLSVDINNLIKIRLHSSFDDAYEISLYLTQNFVIVWDQEPEQKSKLLIFSEKIKNVLEVKKIDLGLNKTGEGIIDIIYSDITHSGHRGLMRIEGDYLSYFNQKGQDVHIVSLKDSKEVFSTKKKTNFFKPKQTLKNNAQSKNLEKDEEEEEYSEEEKDKVEEDLKNEKNQKDSLKNLEVKETKDQSQSLTDKKNNNIIISPPEEILSNNNLQNEQNPLNNANNDQKADEQKKEEESEKEEEEDEDEEKSKNNKKNKKDKKSSQIVNNKRNKYFCKCTIFQMTFFL